MENINVDLLVTLGVLQELFKKTKLWMYFSKRKTYVRLVLKVEPFIWIQFN